MNSILYRALVVQGKDRWAVYSRRKSAIGHVTDPKPVKLGVGHVTCCTLLSTPDGVKVKRLTMIKAVYVDLRS